MGRENSATSTKQMNSNEGAHDIVDTLTSQLGVVTWAYDVNSLKFIDIHFEGDTYLGWTKDEWLTLNIWPDNLHPDDMSRVTSKSFASRKDGKNIDVEYRLKTANEDYRWVRELSGATHLDDETVIVKGVFFDVTDFHAAHGLAPEREHQYRKLLDALPDGFLIEQDDTIVFANPAALETFGADKGTSMVGVKTDQIFCDWHHAQARVNSLTKGGQRVCSSNESVRSLTGREYDAEVVSCMTVWGNKPAIQSVVRDISWLSEILELLREEKNLGKLVLDHIGDGVCVVDENGLIKSVNPAAERILGRTEDECKGEYSHELLHLPEPFFPAHVNTQHDPDHPQIHQFETSLERISDGATLHLHIDSNPIFNKQNLIGAVITIRDLTFQKNSEAEIIKLTKAIEQSPVGIVVSDTVGQMVYVNPQFCDMTGLAQNDFYGKQSPLLSEEPLDADIYNDIWSKLKAGVKWEGDIPKYNANNKRVWIRGIVSALRDDNNEVMNYLGMYTDITREEYARAAQKATESKVNTIFNAIGNAIFILTENGVIESVNPAGCRLFGYDLNDFQELAIDEILPELNFDLFKATLARSTDPEAETGGFHPNREFYGIHQDGRQIPVLLTIANMPQPTWEFDDRRENTRRTFICALQDISDLKEAQNAIENAQKMDALGQLTGGLAHDFNNLLGIVIGNLDLAEEEANGVAPISKYIMTSRRAALRGADLTRNLLDFSRSAAINTETVDINEAINELAAMIKPALTARISFKTSLDDNLWNASLNRSEFMSSLMNLIFNARDAMTNAGELFISTENFDNPEPIPMALGICPPGKYILIRVTDTGDGMDEATLDKIFEPFFTTKPKGKGTGLGLSAVFGFVHRANGWIDVMSAPGKGTSVMLMIPQTSENMNNSDAIHEHKTSQNDRSGELLVVDDEVELAEFCSFTLKNAGYVVHQAKNGAEALDILRDNPRITTIVSDIVMPGELDGIDLCGKVAEMDDKVKVILTTGYTEKLDGKQGLPVNCHDLLRKPFRAIELLKCVDSAYSLQK